MSLARWLILLGAIVLFLGAIAHMIGYTFFIPVLIQNNLSTKYVNAVRAVWLVFSLHMILLSIGIVWLSRLPGSRRLVLFFAMIPTIDASVMFHFVGLFLGFYMVAIAAVLLLAGAWLMPRDYARLE
jgi:hypothetical protein